MPLTPRPRPRLLLTATVLAGVTVASSAAHADQILISANVPATCTVTDGTLDFGNFTGEQVTTTTTFEVACSASTTVDVTLGGGQGAFNATTRFLQHDTDTAATLAYSLFRGDPTNGGETWNPDTSKSVQVNGQPAEVEVGGILVADSTPTAGTYTDIVTVTYEVN